MERSRSGRWGVFPVCSKHAGISERLPRIPGKRLFAHQTRSGTPIAAYVLAREYGYESNAIYNVAKAVEYCQIASDRKYAPAQYLLGYSYTTGFGVQVDVTGSGADPFGGREEIPVGARLPQE